MKNRYYLDASNISQEGVKESRRHMTISMRMFSTRKNLNGVAVTEAFIDRIIANKDDYVCMPLCADTRKLKAGDYRGLGHMFDRRTGKYLADEIGSFYDLEKVTDEYGVSLYGVARINKRSDEVCNAIQEQYDRGELSFSFEIEAETISVIDGVTIVDAGEGNDLMGMAIVYYPACPEARAQTLVAEVEDTNAFKSIFASANVQLAELDIEIVQGKVWEIFERRYRDDVWCIRVLLLCPDCVIYYDKNGRTWKVEYRIEDNEMYVTDWYEVEFARTQRGEIGMDNEKMVAENAVASAEVSVEEEKKTEAVASEVVEEKKQEEEVTVEQAKERDDSRCAELSAQVEALIRENESLKAEIEQYKAEEAKREAERVLAEQEQKKAEMVAFAEKNGLNTKDEQIAAAIENMDYAYLMAQSMSAKPARESGGASLRMSAEIGVSDPYGGLLKRA